MAILTDGGDPASFTADEFDAAIKMIQKSVDHEYQSFIGRVAQARKTTPDKIDAVAQGRVWSGSQALERGLVDRLGLYGDALKSAAVRAKLGDDPRVVYIEREPGAFESWALGGASRPAPRP